MNLNSLQNALSDMKSALESAIITATYKGKVYQNGHEAKEALIRSQRLIMRLHEVVKTSLHEELTSRARKHDIYPAVGQPAPELPITGLIKNKKQDVVVLFDGDTPSPEKITEGALSGTFDRVGKKQSERAAVVGVRSQLSSVGKNFDTLMERAFAETLNLRLRLPGLVMGEVYLLPVVDYDGDAMIHNKVVRRKIPIKIDKFIRTFSGISHRNSVDDTQELYKYERTALVLVDFEQTPPKIFLTLDELKAAGYLPASYEADFDSLSPAGFVKDLLDVHERRHPPRTSASQ